MRLKQSIGSSASGFLARILLQQELWSCLQFNKAVCLQVNEVEGLLAQAERKAEALQSDKERLLSMVSRLELDKHRLESGRTPAPQPQATPGSGGRASGYGSTC